MTLILLVIEKQNYRASVRAEMEGGREGERGVNLMNGVSNERRAEKRLIKDELGK